MNLEYLKFLSEMSKTHLVALELIFISLSWWVYEYKTNNDDNYEYKMKG